MTKKKTARIPPLPPSMTQGINNTFIFRNGQ